jgi:outer membrane protein assembly factor BamB
MVVNAACASTYRDVPRDGANDVHDYLGAPGRAPATLEAIDSAPTRVWRATVGRGTLGALAVGERVTAVATVDRWIYALDTRTGRVYWRFRGDLPYGTGPLIGDGLVFAASEGGREAHLIAISLLSGKRRWSTTVGDVSTPLAYRSGTVYGATSSGGVFALRGDNGKRRWMRQSAPGRTGPLPAGAWLALVTLTDTLVVLDTASGAVVSRTPLPFGTLAPLALLDDSTVVLASPAGAVLALALPGGSVRWRVDTGRPVYGAPVVTGDTVFALTNDGALWVIPARDPSRAASEAIGTISEAAPAIVRGGVIVATVGGELVYYDRTAHRRVWTRQTDGELRHPPIVRSGQILAAPVLGHVVSFR